MGYIVFGLRGGVFRYRWTFIWYYGWNIYQGFRWRCIKVGRRDGWFWLIIFSSWIDHHNSYFLGSRVDLIFWNLIFLFYFWDFLGWNWYLLNYFHEVFMRRVKEWDWIICYYLFFWLGGPIWLMATYIKMKKIWHFRDHNRGFDGWWVFFDTWDWWETFFIRGV